MTNSDAGREWPLMAGVNAVIDELHGSVGLVDSNFSCECNGMGRRERLTLTRAQYGSLREDGRPVLAAVHAQRESSAGVGTGERTIGQTAPRLRLVAAGRWA
jgi:hypothetical protein